jgi:competence protein ComEC
MIVSKLSGILGNNRKAKVTRSILCIIVCSIYTSATGAGASIVRALIFVVITEISKILHRKPELKSIFASSLILHLIFRPGDIHSIGFQLSYAAIAGIAWIYPHINSLWPDEGKGIMKRIWNGASLSISCQLTTAPLAWFYFGTFPQYFILTNLIALPLTTLIIPAALLTTILSSMGICPDILIHGTEMMVNALCSTLTIISDM